MTSDMLFTGTIVGLWQAACMELKEVPSMTMEIYITY